jgi:mRNA interferase RelE/StbE
MAYRIVIHSAPERALDRLPSPMAARIERRIDALADDPRPPGCKKLTAVDAWRIRVGDYRVIYQIHDDRLIVLVVRIGHRRDVYD